MRVGNKEPCLNHHLSADWSLQLETMKSESLVIVDQHATVNLYLSLVHTARHTLKVNCTQKNVFDHILAANFFFTDWLCVFKAFDSIFYDCSEVVTR